MAKDTGAIVSGYAEFWPRKVFDLRQGKNRLILEAKELLSGPGVYVLYRDDDPYYIGKTTGLVYDRVYSHANKPKEKHFRFWNYFSAFIVSTPEHLNDVEGLLIASIPRSDNSASPSFERIELPRNITDALLRLRRTDVNNLRG